MACLLALPWELSLQIIQLLDVGDKINLSATCTLYGAQLLPEIIFNTIRFTNDETSAASALITAEAHGQYVKAVEFTCKCDLYDRPTAPSLPPAACKVLKGHLTPNLQMVRLEFDFGLDDEDSDILASDDFDEEDADAIRAKERRYKWRALMNETWEALVANPFVSELILDEFLPKGTSTYYTDAFRQFLGQLKYATFNIFGMAGYDEFRTNTGRGYHQFLSSLDALFFRHMRGLKHLHIHASDPLGLDGYPHIPLALKPEDLPLLQSLRLENCFICPELVSFIKGHDQILQSLDVNECFGSHPESQSWAEFFYEIYKARPRLTELIAGGNKAPFMEPFITDYICGWVDDLVHERTLQKLEADPTIKCFRYAMLDGDDGIFSWDESENMKRFYQGDDQRAYDHLINLINKNKA